MTKRAFSTSIAAALVAAVISAGAARATETVSDPTAGDLQTAYDRAAVEAASLHDAGLKIVGIECDPAEGVTWTCTVGFVKTDERSDRVYLDSALVERRGPADWKLLQGLCRRLL